RAWPAHPRLHALKLRNEQTRHAGNAWLIRRFDDVLADDLDRLRALGLERFACLRLRPGLRLVDALPFAQSDALRGAADHRSDLPGGTEAAAAGRRLRRLVLRGI